MNSTADAFGFSRIASSFLLAWDGPPDWLSSSKISSSGIDGVGDVRGVNLHGGGVGGADLETDPFIEPDDAALGCAASSSDCH